MKKLVAFVLTLTLVGLPIATSARQGQTGNVTGTAVDKAQNPLANHTVRLRNVSTGQTVTTTSNAAGGFSFAGVNPGNFVIEIVNASGNVIATSSTVAVVAGATATITVTATALAGLAGAAGAGGLAGLFTGTSLVVVTAAGIAGVVIAVEATQDEESP